MIARWNIPGSSFHVWQRTSSRSEARDWIRRHKTELQQTGETTEARVGRGSVLTEKEAARIRYLDGRMVYPKS